MKHTQQVTHNATPVDVEDVHRRRLRRMLDARVLSKTIETPVLEFDRWGAPTIRYEPRVYTVTRRT